MADRRSMAATVAGIACFVVAAALFVTAVATKSTLGTLAMTAAQLGVLAFYWFPWSFAWGSRPLTVATVFAVILLAVSLAIIGLSGLFLIQSDAPFLGWGPFLIVHLGANIALALRPRVYLWWLLGVWTVGPLVFLGAMVLIAILHPGGWPPLETFLMTLFTHVGHDWQGAPQAIFWLFSLCSFTGSAGGLGFALIWRWARIVKDRERLSVPGDVTPSGTTG